MSQKDKKVNVTLLSSVVVALVLVMAILYTVATKENSRDVPDAQTYEIIEESQAPLVEDSQTEADTQTEPPLQTDAQVVYTEDGVVSISNESNDIYIEGGGNVNVQIDGNVVVSGDGETDGVEVSQDGNSNVNIGNVGNGEIIINN